MEASNVKALRAALTKVKEWMEHRIRTCGFEDSATFPTMLEDVVLPALSIPTSINEEYAKPKLCKSCAHYMTDGCEICECTDYEKRKEARSEDS